MTQFRSLLITGLRAARRSRTNRTAHTRQPAARVEGLEARTFLSTSDVVIGQGAARSARFTDPDGTTAMVFLRGNGSATVTVTGDNLSQTADPRGVLINGSNITLTRIAAIRTNASTILTITAKGGDRLMTAGDITADGALGGLNAPATDLTGDLTAGGSIRDVRLNSATNGTISAGSRTGGALDIRVNNAVNESVLSSVPIRSVAARQWINSGANDGTLTAPSIGSITVPGAFSPNISLTGVGFGTQSLGSVRAGSITGGDWSVAGNSGSVTTGSIASGWSGSLTGGLKSLNVAHDATIDLTAGSIQAVSVRGSLSDSHLQLIGPPIIRDFDLGRLSVGGNISATVIRAIGSIGSITAAGLQDSRIYAGIVNLPNGKALPTVATEFAANSTITSIKVKRSAGASFINSNVAATSLGALDLGTVRLANGGASFGLSGRQIRQLTFKDEVSGKTLRARNITSPAALATLLSNQGINPQDFVVRIV